jgi:CHASE2 domain-containing sensor protein
MKEQVVIAAIDEQSLKEQGRWPWPRTLHAQLIDKISEAGAKAIAFNIFFPENDLFIPMENVREGVKNEDGVPKGHLSKLIFRSVFYQNGIFV